MDKKQYNNVIDWTLKHEAQAQSKDSLQVTRTICNELGVALPQGDLAQVAEVLATDDYMGWKACAQEEAQEAANNGIPAIGISNDQIVMLAAEDEEQPVANAFAVMTLSNDTKAMGDSMAYYAHSAGTTTLDETDEQPQNRLLVEQIINQGDTSVKYPNINKSAFTDKDFLKTWCDRPESDFTIASDGCAICCVASFILHKAGVECNNNNKFKAVEQVVKYATNKQAWLYDTRNFKAEINGVEVNVQMELSKNSALQTAVDALKDGKKCIIRMKSVSNKTHYVLADGYNDDACDVFHWLLVCDPDGGEQRTLYDAINRRSNKNHSPQTDEFSCRIIE